MESSAQNQLIEIPPTEWLLLRDLFKEEWPEHRIAFSTIQTYINWFQMDPKIKNIKIFSLNGEWKDGTFIILDRFNVSFYTKNRNYENLVSALNLLDKSKYYNLLGYSERMLPAVQKYFQLNNWPFNPSDCRCALYYKSKEDCSKFEIIIPEGFFMKILNEEYAEEINSNWHHKHPGSLTTVRRNLRYHDNIGIFRKDSGELVGWCFKTVFGTLGLLHIKEEYKRRGLGILLVKIMAKRNSEKGLDCLAPVVESNHVSRNMFEKLGFLEIDKLYWNDTIASDPNFVWAEDDAM